MAVMLYVPDAMPSFGRDGQPVIAELRFYLNGTTTPATVYTDPALSVPWTFPIVSNSSGQFDAVWAADAAVFSVIWSTDDGQSESWDDISGAASANAAILAATVAARTAAQTAETAAEAAAAQAQTILDQVIAYGGSDGWTPILAAVPDGARVVLSIGWTGGDGPPPTSGFLGPAGVVATAAAATDIRGFSGAGSGDVVKFGTPTVGYLATWSSTSTIQGTVAYDWATLPNKPAFATQAEALTGTSNALFMSPLRVAQVFATAALQQMTRLTKTTNYQFVQNDRGAVLEISGTVSLSFDAPVGLGAAWFAYVHNNGTGDVNVSGTDGLASFAMYPGEIRLFQSNGTDIKSYVLKGFSRTFTATGLFIKPPGYNDFEGEAWGGGGSGAVSATQAGGGGGAVNVPFKVPASALGATVAVTIGAGGAAVVGSGVDANGNPGGNTTFGTFVTAYAGAQGSSGGSARGGGGGGAFGAGVVGGQGGEPTTSGALNNSGFGGGYGGGFGGGGTSNGGDSIYGGGGGGLATSLAGNSLHGGGGGGGASSSAETLGGTSRLGGAGGRGRSATNGVGGVAPGGGGGGTGSLTATSGAGARGELRIRGVA